MSSVEGTQPCPVCDEEMLTYSENKPYEYTIGECLNCGFCYYPMIEQATLRNVNRRRKEEGMKPLKREDLKRYTKDIKDM